MSSKTVLYILISIRVIAEGIPCHTKKQRKSHNVCNKIIMYGSVIYTNVYV